MFALSSRPAEQDGKIKIRFESVSKRLSHVNVDILHKKTDNYYLQSNVEKPEQGDTSCFFADELERIRTLDSSASFKRTYFQLSPLVQSMAELIHHQDKVVAILCSELKACDPIHMGSFFDLFAVLYRDLQDSSMKHFHMFMKSFVAILNAVALSGGHANESAPNPELTGKLFETVGYLLKSCAEHLSLYPQELSSYYGPILGNSIEFVRTFGAKTFLIIFRKMKVSTFAKHLKKIFRALAQNFNSACEGDLNKISLVERNDKSQHNDQEEEKRSKWLIHGMSRLLYVTFKGIKGEIHSKAVEKIKELLSIVSSFCVENSDPSIDDQFFVKTIGCILCRCLHLLHFHLSKDNQHSLVLEEVEFLGDVTSMKNANSKLQTIVLSFSSKLVLMMLTIGHGKVLADSSTRKAALSKINEASCSLFRHMYLDAQRDIGDRRESQELFSTIWLLSPSSKKLSTVFTEVLPQIELNMESLSLLCDLVLSLGKLPYDIYFDNVLSAVASLVETSITNTNSENLMAFLSHILYVIYDPRENSDAFAADSIEPPHDYSLLEFQRFFRGDDWASIFSTVLKTWKKSSKKNVSGTESTYILRIISWLVRCLSPEQIQSFAADIGRIVSSVNELLIEEEKSLPALLVDYMMFNISEILVSTAQQSLLPATTRNTIFESIFQLAMSRSHSVFRSYSLSILLPIHHDRDRSLLSSIFDDDGVEAFCLQAATTLSNSTFWERITVLRTLTYLSPPTLGGTVDEEGHSTPGKQVDVVGLLIELASLPVNLKNEREITRRFETLEVLCRGNKLPKSFLSLIAGFCLGMYRTKFKPVWAPASAVLVTIAQHDDGEDILWPFLENNLNKYGDDDKIGSDLSIHKKDVLVGEMISNLWCDNDHDHFVLSLRNTPLFPFHIGKATQQLTVAPDSVADTETTFLQLLGLLTKATNIPIKRSKFVVGIFIRFLHSYYAVFSTDVEIPYLLGIGLLEENLLQAAIGGLARKTLRGRLIGFLKMFAAIPGPKQLHKHHLLYVYYYELLCKADVEVAKNAFECICGYKPAAIIPYKERFKNLFDDRKFRNETLEISASLSSKEEPMFAAEHVRTVYLFIVRVLYGLLLSKPTTSRKEKDAIKSRRAAIFSFVAQLGSDSAEYLMFFMVRGLLPSSILREIPVSYIDQRTNMLDNKMHDALINNIHSPVLQTLQSDSTHFHFNDASWDRLKGYLYSLQPAFSNIGFVMSSMVPLVYKTLYMIIQMCTAVKSKLIQSNADVDDSEDDEPEEDEKLDEENEGHKNVEHLVEMKVSSECRTLAMQRIAEMLDQYNKIYHFSDGKEKLIEGLTPLLLSLQSALHSARKTPAILLLLHRLAQYKTTVPLFVDYHDLLLNNCISCLSIAKLHVESARMMTQIFQHVIDFSGSTAFLPYAERIVSMFVRRLQGPETEENAQNLLKLSEIDVTSLGSVREEVDLLCRIATDVFARDDVKISTVSATNFATIIMGILRSYTNSSKTKITEDWVMNMLVIYRSFITRIDNVSGHVSFFSRTFGPSAFAGSRLNARPVRSQMLITYGMLCEHPSVSKVLDVSYTVLSNLMKQDSGIVESRDFTCFMPYVQALSSPAGATVGDKLISWDTLMGPTSYRRQGKKVSRSISEHVSICSAVLFDLIRCLYENEMALRTSAAIAIKQLITEASSWISSHSKDWVCVFQAFLIPAIRKGVQQSTDLIKAEFLSIFSHYIAVAAANKEYGSLFCDHIDLAFLRSEDRDQDFFHNITHIQVHRRARAFLRLHRLLRDTENNHTIGVPSFVHILLPLTIFYLTSEEYTKKAHSNLIEEVTQLIGAICAHLPWNHYMNTFRKMIRLLQRADAIHLKMMQTVVCTVLDNFHFPLNELSKPTIMDIDNDASNDNNDSDNETDEEEQDNDEELKTEQQVANVSGGKSMVDTVVNQILPTVKQFLLRTVQDHKGNKTEEVQTNIAVALTNLLLHLEPPAVSEEERMTLFSSLVIKVVQTLKSRDSNIRDAARHCLAKMINILGMAALRPVVYELQSNLREGFQHHVAAYSLRSILLTVLENYQAPNVQDEAVLQLLLQGSNVTEEDFDEAPHFDQALDLIMQFVLEDISTDMKEDRESEGALRSVIREQKGSKFREILEIVARCLLFRPTYALRNPSSPQSVSSIHAVSMPLLNALTSGEDNMFTGRVTEALTQVAVGLSKNSSIRDKELLLYVHATLQPFVTQMLTEYRKYREALGKLVAPTKAGKKQTAVVDDDSDFEIDLPSYMREEDSDDDEKFEFMKDANQKKKKDNDPDAIDKQKAATWLPTDARSLKDQRAVVEARNLEQKERIRVQDGASAPKLTGRNRYDLAHRKGKNAAGISKVTLVAIKFCLSLMLSSIKRGIFASNNLEVQSMMVPFIPLLRSFLHIPNASEVVALSIKVIGALVSWGIPLDAQMHARLTNRILLIMIRHCASISTENELCQACIKSLVSMFKYFNDQIQQYEKQIAASEDSQRAKKDLERPKFPLDELKLRSLVEMLTVSITDITSSFQNPAFQLIKEIVRSRVLLPEIYDLMKKLTEQIVLSHRKGIRETSSQIVIQFMITYPMGNKRSESQLVQLLNNCNYEFEEGRCSAMETIYHILRSFPIPVIEEHAYRFFFPMTLKLVNETSRVCRDWAVQILSMLFRRVLNVDLLHQFQDFALKWLSTIVNTAASKHWNDETTAVVRTGAQVMSIFVRSRLDVSSRSESMQTLVDMTYTTLCLLRHTELDEETDLRHQGKAVILPPYWHTVYHLVLMLEEVFASAPAVTDAAIASSRCLAEVSGETHVDETTMTSMSLMEQVLDMLLYRHMWVRATAARLLSAYFQRRAPQRKSLVLFAQGQELFQTPNFCYQLARKTCVLLNQSAELSTSLLDTLAKNLAYIVQVLVYHPELDTYAPKVKDMGENEDEEREEEEEENDNVDVDVDAEDEEDEEVDPEDQDVEENDEEEEEEEVSLARGGEMAEEEEAAAPVPEGGLAGVKSSLQLVATTTSASSGSSRIPGTSQTSKQSQTKRKRGSDLVAEEEEEEEKWQAVDTTGVSVESRRGLTWILQRLRAIGADVRGKRRWHVVRCLQVMLTSQVLSKELVEKYAELLMEPLVRVISSAQAAAQLLASEAASGRDTTVMEEQQQEQMTLHVLAKDLLHVMEEQLTPTVYMEVFTKVQTKLQRIRSMKKQTRRAMAVSNPAMFNRMRLEKNQRKRFDKKRKIQGFKDKRGGIRKKMRRN